MNWNTQRLQSNELMLRTISKHDFHDLYQIGSDPLLWEQHPESDRHKEEVFKKFFDEAVAGHAYVIFDTQRNRIIGSSRYYDINLTDKSVAIGYTFLAREYWGGKTNRQLKQLMLNHAFQFVDKVYFHVGSHNYRSQKAIQKLGALKVREFSKMRNGIQSNNEEYLLEKNQWRAQA